VEKRTAAADERRNEKFRPQRLSSTGRGGDRKRPAKIKIARSADEKRETNSDSNTGKTRLLKLWRNELAKLKAQKKFKLHRPDIRPQEVRGKSKTFENSTGENKGWGIKR